MEKKEMTRRKVDASGMLGLTKTKGLHAGNHRESKSGSDTAG